MKRLAILAVLASGAAFTAQPGEANAQPVCCADPAMRGYMPAPPPPAYQPPPPAYAQGGYPQGGYPQGGYIPAGPPPGREPVGSGLRGYVGVEYSEARLDPGSPSPRVDSWTGEAAVALPLGSLGLQADIKASNFSGPDGDDWIISPTAHLYGRSPLGLVGAFAGVSNTAGATLYGGGLEGQANLSNATLYGSVGFGRLNDGVDANVTAARIEGRYFITDNLRVDASIGYLRQSAGADRSEAIVSGIGAEYQLGVVPASIHVGYQHSNVRNSPIESDTLRVGVRWAFNGQSLIERDRYGPSLANISDIFMGN